MELALQLLFALSIFGIVLLATARLAGRARRPAGLERMRRMSDEPHRQHRGLSWDDLRVRGPSNFPVMRDLLMRSSWARRMTTEIDQAGVRLRVGEYILIRCALAFVVFALVVLVGRTGPSVIFGLALGAVGFMLPAFWLSTQRKRRRDHISRQLPEAAQMIANSLRAGFSFQHGMQLVSEQLEPPIADEFARVNLDMTMGSTIEEALLGFVTRVDTSQVHLVVTAVLIQRTAGGNLAEILEMVAEQIRERERLTGEVKTMTSQQRFSGLVLSAWPLLLLGAFCILNWDQTSLLFTTNIGLVLIGTAAVLQVLGYLTIGRILDVEI